MTNTIALSKSLTPVQWEQFFDQFSGDHRGQHITIKIIDSELGDQELRQFKDEMQHLEIFA
jgi:hypothetical protein